MKRIKQPWFNQNTNSLMTIPDPASIRPCRFTTRGRVLTITVGLPASGKSTFAKTAGFDLAVSLDDCREMLWGSRQMQNGPGGINSLLALQETLFIEAMRENKSVIVHNTSILKKHRTPLIELAKAHGYRTQIIYFDVPVEECIRRNHQRNDAVPPETVESFAARMEVPAVDEADRVVTASMLDKSID